ncbi:hypothetical protein [Duncaniella freteri]|uniref:hypothetical protein n=1 Tax=Duncaniella freteri TaxID=2530391 RepID=UPI00256EED93|nr:hypothetical protein [Duncaniella freteri]
MKILLTNPDILDQVLAKLDEQYPLGEYNQGFVKYCVPVIKERLANGEMIYLEATIGNTNFGVCQILSYWSPHEIPTDEEYLQPDYDKS